MELNILTTDDLNKYLLQVIPQTEQDRVFNQDKCDIDHNFLGFIDTYYHLSRIIPEDYTIIDFGAAYNAQSYFFVNHSRYIAVTPLVKEAFKPDNCTVYKLTTGEFLSQADYPKIKYLQYVIMYPDGLMRTVLNLSKNTSEIVTAFTHNKNNSYV